MKLSIDRLRTLALIDRTGSLSAAATELGIGPSAVSQQITKLEQELGEELLVRTTKPARLTPLGATLAGYGAAILENFERAVAAAELSNEVVAGRFDVGTIPTVAISVLSDALADLRTSSPDLDVRVHDAEMHESIRMLAAYEIDISIVDQYDAVPIPLPEQMTVIPLGSELVQIFGSAETLDHYDADSDIPLDSLANHSWILPPESTSCGAAALALCHAAGFDPDVRLETNDLLLLRSFAADGFGITMLPQLATRTGSAACTTRNIKGRPRRSIHAIVRESTRDRPSEHAFLDAVKRAAAMHLDPPNT